MHVVNFVNTSVFQFTPLREGRRGGHMAPVLLHQFQFTPLREGRQKLKFIGEIVNIISIHAPA